jgi:hypothetical protein
LQAEQFCAKENNLNDNNPEVNEEKMDILGTIDEDYSEAKDHEAEIEEKIIKDFDEIKSNGGKSQYPIILVEGNTQKFIDFIGVEIFSWVLDSYLVNLVNCMKIKFLSCFVSPIDELQE